MKWLVTLTLSVILCGCISQKPAYPEAAASATHNPNSDYVGQDVLTTAIERKASSIPEQFSQIQDSGLVHYSRDNAFVRNPDGTVFTLKGKGGQEIPLAEEHEAMTKWANLFTLGGNVKKVALKIGNIFNPGAEPGMVKYAGVPRDGFSFEVEEAEGGIGRESGTITAKYEGQAKVLAQIEKALGTALDKHWTGLSGTIKVRNDGLVEIVGKVGEATKTVIGELVKFTAYGAGASVVQAIVDEIDGEGEVQDTNTEVTVTAPQG